MLGCSRPEADFHSAVNFALTELVGVRLQRARSLEKVKKERTATQNSSGIHRVLVLMPVCMRIRARREKQTRCKAGAQCPGASGWEVAGLSNGGDGATKLRSKREGCGCDFTSNTALRE